MLTRSEVVGSKVVLSVTVEMVEGGKETSFSATDWVVLTSLGL